MLWNIILYLQIHSISQRCGSEVKELGLLAANPWPLPDTIFWSPKEHQVWSSSTGRCVSYPEKTNFMSWYMWNAHWFLLALDIKTPDICLSFYFQTLTRHFLDHFSPSVKNGTGWNWPGMLTNWPGRLYHANHNFIIWF